MDVRKLSWTVCAALLIAPAVSHAAYNMNADSIYKYIAVLASDSLEGRQVGEAGEWKAATYIKGIFQQVGLVPKGDNGTYLQAFDFNKRIDFGPKNKLAINGKSLSLRDEFLPMYQSGSSSFLFKDVVPVGYGITTADSAYDDYKDKNVEGKAVLVMRYAPKPETNPHVDFDKYSSFTDKIINAQAHKAAGIFFITPSDQDDTLVSMGGAHVTQKDIPIMFLRRKGMETLGLSITEPTEFTAQGETQLVPVRDTGYNVVGYLPTGNDTTVVIGAHFDHLGWGGEGSRYLGKEKKIHYGADDNGSGSAGMLELARYFTSIKDQLHYSILFIGFSGEEAGLLGSSYFVKHWTIDSSKARMMINMDMIGRLRAQDKGLAIFGTGTCTEFKQYFDSTFKDSTMKLSFQETGTAPSDGTAFYNDGVPVLFFFTGQHEDYHTPEDVVDKIDTHGIIKVITMVADIEHHFDHTGGRLTFQKTKNTDTGGQRTFSVTLGIMPDYVATVKGLKVDGVSPDRPAEKAGILKGDVIIKMGQYTIDDIYTYMNALGKFRKGDSCQVALERGKDTLELMVRFK
jgi:aminopeptidase YwaD